MVASGVPDVPAAAIVRPRTLNLKRLSKKETSREEHLDTSNIPRPETRADCLPGEMNEHRPCPFVTCKYHLAFDVNEHGNIKVNFPAMEPWEIPETCSLDIADRDSASLEVVSNALNITLEGVRMIEQKALAKLKERDGDLLQAIWESLSEEPEYSIPDNWRVARSRFPIRTAAAVAPAVEPAANYEPGKTGYGLRRALLWRLIRENPGSTMAFLWRSVYKEVPDAHRKWCKSTLTAWHRSKKVLVRKEGGINHYYAADGADSEVAASTAGAESGGTAETSRVAAGCDGAAPTARSIASP